MVLTALLVAVLSACDLIPDPPEADEAFDIERPREGPILPNTPAVPPGGTTPGPAADPTGPDLRLAVLPAIDGQPFPPFIRDLHDGSASLNGIVRDPEGKPVAGARVRVDRVTAVAEQRLDLSTNAEGRWGASGLSGGRYRVRAWLQPELAALEPGAVFVTNGQQASVEVSLTRPSAFALRLETGPASPRAGESSDFIFAVTTGSVDGEGRIINAPLAGIEVRLPSTATWANTGPDTATTDGAGRVVWSARCSGTGPSESVTVTAIRPSPPPTSPTGGGPGPSRPPATADPTPTPFQIALPACQVAFPQPELGAGEPFSPPFRGAIPAGRYTVDGPGTCAISYQAWFVNGWLPQRATHVGNGDMQLPWPVRDLRRATGSPTDCVYERAA